MIVLRIRPPRRWTRSWNHRLSAEVGAGQSGATLVTCILRDGSPRTQADIWSRGSEHESKRRRSKRPRCELCGVDYAATFVGNELTYAHPEDTTCPSRFRQQQHNEIERAGSGVRGRYAAGWKVGTNLETLHKRGAITREMKEAGELFTSPASNRCTPRIGHVPSIRSGPIMRPASGAYGQRITCGRGSSWSAASPRSPAI